MAIQISQQESRLEISHSHSASALARPASRRAGWGGLLRPAVPLPQASALAFLLVGIVTWLLFSLEHYLIAHDHLRSLRPFGVGYFVPIIILTACGGRRAGWLTLLLSGLSAVFFLTKPLFSWHIYTARDCAEIIMLVAVGSLIVMSVEAMRQNTLMFAEITETAEGKVVQDAVRRTALAVPGVSDIPACILRRRGFDIYLDLDVTVAETTTLAEARRIVAEVERAAYRSHALVFQARARIV